MWPKEINLLRVLYCDSGKLEMNFSSICLVLCLLLHVLVGIHSESAVRYLPGFDGALPFQLRTGYVSIDDDSGAVEMFYYFFKSESKPSKDPLIFWFTGGPGCSGLSCITFDIGPLSFNIAEYNGTLPTLKLNSYSWTKVSNIVFLDQPTGTGFSYSRTSKGYPSDTTSTKQAYIFIKKWLMDHPEFLLNPIYVCGDSYAGRTVPIIIQHISNGIAAGDKVLINFKGYVLGNPITDGHLEKNSVIPFSYGMGILSKELYESAKKNCGREYVNVDPNNVQCRKDLQVVSKCVEGIYANHILEPKCLVVASKSNRIVKYRGSLEQQSMNAIRSPPGVPGFECRSYGYMLSYYWANDKEVQAALNVRKGKTREWVRCKWNELHYVFNVQNTTRYHVNLSRNGYRSLIYSGDHDMIVPFMSTQAWIKSLNYDIIDDWRPWFVKGQIGGYTRTYANNMTFTTIKGGGHTAAEYKPRECFNMVKRWLAYEPL